MSDYEQLLRTVNILTVFEIIFFVISAVCLIIAVILFFKNEIPIVISEVSGKKKQKQLEQMKINRQIDNSGSFEVKYKSVENENPQPNKHKKRSDTIQKDNAYNEKRHETTLTNNKRQTTVIDENGQRNGSRKQHNTTVMEKKDRTKKKYDALDETIMIHSDEIIK